MSALAFQGIVSEKKKVAVNVKKKHFSLSLTMLNKT
jgi:hypothetical protein